MATHSHILAWKIRCTEEPGWLQSMGLQKSFTWLSNIPLYPANGGDMGLIPGLGKPPGEGQGNRLQYTCLGNPMDRATWLATVHGVAKSQV
jgi:hypothetical protein